LSHSSHFQQSMDDNSSRMAPQQLAFEHEQQRQRQQPIIQHEQQLFVERRNEEIEIDSDTESDDEHLFMPISATLSGTALRALISSLRIKCKKYEFKSKQQSKFIIESQRKLSEQMGINRQESVRLYDLQQNELLQANTASLEYLRGAELHQTRQELAYLMEQMNACQNESDRLRQQCKLRQLESESRNKSLRSEYERTQREMAQMRVMFEQRKRECDDLRQNSDAQMSESEQQINAANEYKKESEAKIKALAEQLAALRDKFEEAKAQCDALSASKAELSEQLKSAHLAMEESEQRFVSLQRVRANLEQEIEALSRSNRHCRDIRDKSTTQILSAQQCEIESAKEQIAQKYIGFLEEERIKNEKLRQLIAEKDVRIGELNQASNECMDPYNCSPIGNSDTASMDEFGSMMLAAAKEEIESLRQTNEKLMRLHTKNHFKKPRVQEACTQTYSDNALNSSMNSSFCTVDSAQTAETNQTNTNFFIQHPEEQEKGDTVLINDTSMITTDESIFC